jgi:transcriptional regulator with XRE-family HTH domain
MVFERNGRRTGMGFGPSDKLGKPLIKDLERKFECPILPESIKLHEEREHKERMAKYSGGQGIGVGEYSPPDTFGGVLARARVAAGFSQRDLGKHTGADQGTISSWERNVQSPFVNYFPNGNPELWERKQKALRKLADLFPEVRNYISATEPIKIEETEEMKFPAVKVALDEKRKTPQLPTPLNIVDDRKVVEEIPVQSLLNFATVTNWLSEIAAELYALRDLKRQYEQLNIEELKAKADKYDKMKELLG